MPSWLPPLGFQHNILGLPAGLVWFEPSPFQKETTPEVLADNLSRQGGKFFCSLRTFWVRQEPVEAKEEASVCLPPSGDITLPCFVAEPAGQGPAHPLGAPRSAAAPKGLTRAHVGRWPVLQKQEMLVWSWRSSRGGLFSLKQLWLLLGTVPGVQAPLTRASRRRALSAVRGSKSGGKGLGGLGGTQKGQVLAPALHLQPEGPHSGHWLLRTALPTRMWKQERVVK